MPPLLSNLMCTFNEGIFCYIVNNICRSAKSAIFIAFLVTFVTTDLNAQSAEELSAIQSHMAELSHANDKIRSNGASVLGQHHYLEVAEALIKAISKELNSGRANTFVIGAAVASLNNMPTSSLLNEIDSLISLLNAKRDTDSKLSNPKTFDAVESQLKNLWTNCKGSKTKLPKLEAANQKRIEEIKVIQQNNIQPLTAEELVLALEKPEAKNLLAELTIGAERVLSDDFINTIRANKTPPKYKGRDKELEKTLQGLLRLEKGHILLTGKAGVGKTTLLKMLVRGWYSGSLPYPGMAPPLVFEMSILDITNPNDPSALKNKIKAAKKLSKMLNRRIVLFYDEAHVATSMSKNAIKNMLTEALGQDSLVHMIWATTSGESRAFLSDSAFSRRWVEVNVREFTNQESIEAIEAAYVPQWQEIHSRAGITFKSISDEAYQVAANYSHLEQPHAGNPTGLKELLEGTIIYKLRELEKIKNNGASESDSFQIEPSDIRSYLKFQAEIKLFAGDKDFNQEFNKLWDLFRQEYVGNEAFIESQKQVLYSYFLNIKPDKLIANILAGPPGGGKSFYPEVLAKVFFNTVALEIKGSDYNKGGLSINKIQGSPPGTVGSEEQRSILSKYIRDNPHGGVITVREADFAHIDFYNFWADIITSKKFVDGLGHEYDMSRYLIFFETNVGQEYLLDTQSTNKKMTWDELELRRKNIMLKKQVGGKTLEYVRPDILSKIMESFFSKINANTDEPTDSATDRQHSVKFQRRFRIDYVSLPTREELESAAKIAVNKFINKLQTEYGIKINIDEKDFLLLLDLDKIDFSAGHSWVKNKLDENLFSKLQHLYSERGQEFTVSVTLEILKIGVKDVSGLALKIDSAKGSEIISLGISMPTNPNPWFSSTEMRSRIQGFTKRMNQLIKGQDDQKKYMESALKRKFLNWGEKIVISQIGTSGNGKTEFGFSLAEALFEDRRAAFKISGLQRWGDLHNYFRSDTGFVGSLEETEFERWFMARKRSGGGVIIWDELLSFDGLSKFEISEKINLINKLYDVFDEQKIKFGSRVEDASAFIHVITGNALQNLFNGIDDSPEAERLIKRILSQVSKDDIEKQLGAMGLDAPKIARLGKFFLNGPLPKNLVHEVGVKEVNKMILKTTEELKELYDISVQIDPEIIRGITDRVTTVRLGMRKVQDAIKDIIAAPISGILFDQIGVDKIEAHLYKNEIIWTANNRKIIYTKNKNNRDNPHSWIFDDEKTSEVEDITPQLASLEVQPKIIFSEQTLKSVAIHELYGHWMTGYLLSGKNPAQTISLIPNNESLGYVRPLDQKIYDIDSLTSLLVEMTTLQAGHRAVFKSGIYAVGGGSKGNDQDLADRTDDLGRVEAIINSILSNQLIGHITEFNSDQEKRVLKEVFRQITKRMADRIIRYGMATKSFDGLYRQLITERFLDDEKINNFITSNDFSKIRAPEVLIIWSLTQSIDDLISNLERDYSKDKALLVFKSISNELLKKVLNEITKTRKLKPDDMKQIRDFVKITQKKLIVKKQNKKSINSCEAMF